MSGPAVTVGIVLILSLEQPGMEALRRISWWGAVVLKDVVKSDCEETRDPLRRHSQVGLEPESKEDVLERK